MAELEAPATGKNAALDCVAAIAQCYGLQVDLAMLAHKHDVRGSGASARQVLSIVRDVGLSAAYRRISWEQIKAGRQFFPGILLLKNGNSVILHDFVEEDGQERVIIADPLAETSMPFEIPRQYLEDNWDGSTIFVRPRRRHSFLRSFVLIARNNGVDLSVETLIQKYATGQVDPTLPRFLRIAKEQGFLARRKKITWDGLAKAGEAYPMMALLKDGGAVIITGLFENDEQILAEVVDPYAPHLQRTHWTKQDFQSKCGGDVVLLKRTYDKSDDKQPFGLRWFIPEFLLRKRAFIDVALASLFLQVLGLAMPMYFQIVVDKVLVHHGLSTLQMLGVGMLLVLGFEFVFTFLRGYILLHATSKIDIRVATRTFSKLVSLPLMFFGRAPAGVLIKHMQQADQIRQFLSGKLFMTILDSLALVVLLPILFFYSVHLAFLVLGFSALIALVISVLIPTFRRRLMALYNAEGERQSFLVETIQGMQTVKALALEPTQRVKWDKKAAQAVNMTFQVGKISVSANSLTTLLEKLMSLGIPWLGVYLVFDGELTVGALIAFQMLSGRVSSPLVQIVSLINEYQETALSIRMLGSVMNQPGERDSATRGLTPDIRGDISFEGTSFRYSPDTPPALIDVDLRIPQGAMVGIVGRSGSGKSTLVRLLCGLYPCQEGAVRVDGLDVREIDLGHLRRSIGMVLQENFLFHGTVRENIGLTKSDATFEEIVSAARFAGAHEFIEKLPQGYETVLEENGSNLSGGQKQRIAIARTLITDPRVLVFDEATSALDAESETIIQNSLGVIAKGRTTIMISHRLSMLVGADAILVMEGGRIVASGRHEELLDPKRGSEMYRNLWYNQNKHLLEKS